jgi:hypothetical protein
MTYEVIFDWIDNSGITARRLLLLVAMLTLGACASVKQSSSATPAQDLNDAMALIANRDFKDGEAALQRVIGSKTFSSLSADAQYQALATAGKVALTHGEAKLGYDYLVRALAMPQAAYEDRLIQIDASYRLGYPADTVAGLTALAQRWPERLATYDSARIAAILRLPQGEKLPLLRALYAAHWKYRGQIEPSGLWYELVLLLVEDGQLQEAVEASSRVSDVYILIALRVDRRFDAVVAANPARFDIDAAAGRELREVQAASESAPRSLQLKLAVIETLRHQQHYAAMLAAADAVLVEARSTNYPERVFEDYDQFNNWFLNERATALERVGRWEDAVAQLTSASLVQEDHTGNVSQLINLGELYCNLGRPDEALAAIGRLRAQTSSWGAMEREEVRFDAALQKGDSRQAERSMQYLSEHRADAMRVYQDALIAANQLDAAGKILAARLLDPDQRQGALASIQTFAQAPSTPRVQDLRARRRALFASQDVQAAIRKVGRVESYKLEQENE